MSQSQGSSTLSVGVVAVGVGIDTARYGHHVSFLDEQKRTAAKAFYFMESAAGYQQFQAALTKLAEKQPGLQFHIRLDAAGQYAENRNRSRLQAFSRLGAGWLRRLAVMDLWRNANRLRPCF